MDEREELHIRILEKLSKQDQILENILTQTTKTNGRVTKVEEKIIDLEKFNVAFVTRRQSANWWKDKIGTAAIGIICAAIGFTALLVLQKTDIVDVATISPEQYDSLVDSINK